MKHWRKECSKEGRKDGGKEGRKEGRKEGGKEGRKEGGKEGRVRRGGGMSCNCCKAKPLIIHLQQAVVHRGDA